MFALSQVAYELIEGDYWFGKYGPFKIIIHSKTGYVNATKLCNDGGKRFRNWARLDGSQQLINTLASIMEQKGSILIDQGVCSDVSGLLFDEMGLSPQGNLVKGTYVHPLLIPHIASWCSPMFAMLVSCIVNHYIMSTYQRSLENLQIENSEQQVAIRNLGDTNRQLTGEIKELHSQIESNAFILEQTIAPRVVPFNKMKNMEETFSLYRIGDQQYWAIRCQQRNLVKQSNNMLKKYPNTVRVFYHESEPNAIIYLID